MKPDETTVAEQAIAISMVSVTDARKAVLPSAVNEKVKGML